LRHIVARAGEIAPGERLIVTLEGRSIGVFNIKGELVAIRNSCPHQGGPLCEGVLTGLAMPSRPGEYRYERRGEIVRCPWHGWEFDLRSGQSWFDPVHTRVRSYEVRVEPGATVARGAYVAETYRVSVEDQYVVVEV
jgi:3-phenylpropionate/trans-cinnamate dioxygenase ferredoxin subunit